MLCHQFGNTGKICCPIGKSLPSARMPPLTIATDRRYSRDRKPGYVNWGPAENAAQWHETPAAVHRPFRHFTNDALCVVTREQTQSSGLCEEMYTTVARRLQHA
jgi:hypothetical protein